MNKGIEVLHLMDRDNSLADITVDWSNEKVIDVTYYSNIVSILPFNPQRLPTWKEFEDFLSYRCFDESNGQSEKILRALDMTLFDPERIVRVTNGRNFDDHQWFKFNGGVQRYADILLRERNTHVRSKRY